MLHEHIDTAVEAISATKPSGSSPWPPSLASLAKESFHTCFQNVEQAVEHLCDRLDQDQALQRAINHEIVREAVESVVSREMRSDRSQTYAYVMREPRVEESAPESSRNPLPERADSSLEIEGLGPVTRCNPYPGRPGPSITPDQMRAQAMASIEGARRCALDMPLFGGKVFIRNATRGQLEESAAQHKARGDTHMHKFRFESAVAAMVPKGKRAGDVLSDKQADKLLRDTGGSNV